MINNKVQEAIINQIQSELQSAYVYLAMSAYCENKNLKGFAHWLKLQYQEENQHAMKLYDFLLARGGKMRFRAIEEPQADYRSPIEVFQKVLEHERQITENINNLYALAIAEQDFATQVFLQWFINEQVEEEATAEEILGKLTMLGDKNSAILFIDKGLAKRQ